MGTKLKAFMGTKLPTTDSGAAQQGTCGNYATVEHSENKRTKGEREEEGK